jgi:hypothetical protein
MNRLTRIVSLAGIALALVAGSGQAFPGQTPDEAQTWIQANPTLRPAPGEKLLIRKTATAAQRFTFRSSLLQVGRAAAGPTGGVIRSEEILLFDMLNGITPYRLEESLRSIYGANVYRDYNQARLVYAYPDRRQRNQAVNQNAPLLAAVQGTVREGDRYAYWLEIARRPDGYAYAGKITVFLRSDLPKLQTELQSR